MYRCICVFLGVYIYIYTYIYISINARAGEFKLRMYEEALGFWVKCFGSSLIKAVGSGFEGVFQAHSHSHGLLCEGLGFRVFPASSGPLSQHGSATKGGNVRLGPFGRGAKQSCNCWRGRFTRVRGFGSTGLSMLSWLGIGCRLSSQPTSTWIK